MTIFTPLPPPRPLLTSFSIQKTIMQVQGSLGNMIMHLKSLDIQVIKLHQPPTSLLPPRLQNQMEKTTRSLQPLDSILLLEGTRLK
jgi:hypothetical protein